MESPLRRLNFDTSHSPQPTKNNLYSIAASGTHTPTQTLFRHLSTSSTSSSPTSQYSTRHSSDLPFSSSIGHSNSSSDSHSRSTSVASRSSYSEEDSDLDFANPKASLTISTNFTNFAESPIDPFFKHYTSLPPNSPVLEELYRSQLIEQSNPRPSIEQFRLSLQTGASVSPHPLNFSRPTSQNTETRPLGDAIKFQNKPVHNPLPLVSSPIKKTHKIDEPTTMPHVVTQPTMSTPAMLNRSNSASSESSFNGRATVKAKPAGGKFGGFFGWGSTTTQEIQPTHENEVSLAEQRMSKIPSSIDVSLANAQASHPKRTDSGISLPPRTPLTIEETLEEELRLISADLAASIRREMELEDLVESLQSQAEGQGRLSPAAGRRTSDYFSDSGNGSWSYELELPSKEQFDFERVVRKSEQTQAQIRLEMMEKIQDERARRKGVEMHVRELEEQVSKVDYVSSMNSDAPGRIRELEYSLEDARRKLSEERNLKANFEDLVTAIREELQGYRNERDNLRDEVVPQLRARVEGLEAELAESQKSPYDQTKLQQEIDALREKNASLMETQRQILEMRTQGEQMLQAQSAISPAATPISATFKDKDSLLDKMKDIESQRDALQQVLRNLRMRSELDSKKAIERIRLLEVERDRALRPSYRKIRKDKELLSFKAQLERLRYRSEDAVDAKYVCERNLASLRLDLDRSEQELDDLRRILNSHDALAREMEQLQESYKQLLAQSENDAEIEQVASELRSRSVTNAMLRKRLVDALQKGDQDRLMANSKINALCEMLKSMEEKVADAQQAFEETANEREQEVKDMKESNPSYLRRINENTATIFKPKSSPLATREPKIAVQGTGKSKNTQVHILQHRIEQLEKAVIDADIEMEDVESRLNVTLLEVSELRNETEQSSHHLDNLRSQFAALQSR